MLPIFVFSQMQKQDKHKTYQSSNESDLVSSISQTQDEIARLLSGYIGRLCELQPTTDCWIEIGKDHRLGFSKDTMDGRWRLVTSEGPDSDPRIVTLSDLDFPNLRRLFPHFRRLKLEVIKSSRDHYFELKETLFALREHGLDLAGDEDEFPIG